MFIFESSLIAFMSKDLKWLVSLNINNLYILVYSAMKKREISFKILLEYVWKLR